MKINKSQQIPFAQFYEILFSVVKEIFFSDDYKKFKASFLAEGVPENSAELFAQSWTDVRTTYLIEQTIDIDEKFLLKCGFGDILYREIEGGTSKEESHKKALDWLKNEVVRLIKK